MTPAKSSLELSYDNRNVKFAFFSLYQAVVLQSQPNTRLSLITSLQQDKRCISSLLTLLTIVFIEKAAISVHKIIVATAIF